MTRDLDLIRKILLEIESWPPGVSAKTVTIEDYDSSAVNYHAILLHEVGYIEGMTFGDPLRGKVINPTRLTWNGHEFLDEARNKTVWNKAKKVAEEVGTTSLSIFRTILTRVASSELEQVLNSLNG